MADFIENAQTADDYVPELQLGPSKNVATISFTSQDNDVYVTLFVWGSSTRDPTSEEPVPEGQERFYPAGSGDSWGRNVGGIKFRSAAPGKPATINAVMSFPWDPISTLGILPNGAQLTCCGGLETTDGILVVDPTLILEIGANLALTEPIPGVARVDATSSLAFEKIELLQSNTAATAPASGAQVPLEWDHVSGDSILDLTTPTLPVAKEDGDYIVAVWIADATATVPTLSGFEGRLTLDVAGLARQFAGMSPENLNVIGSMPASHTQAGMTLTAPYRLLAGMQISLTASQGSGADRQAAFQGMIVKLRSGVGAAGSGGLQVARVTVSSAQLLNLAAAPVTIVPPPGAGKIIVPALGWQYIAAQTAGTLSGGPVLVYKFASTPYVDGGGGFPCLFLGANPATWFIDYFGASFWDQTADQVQSGFAQAASGLPAPPGMGPVVSVSSVANQPLMFGLTPGGASPTGGDGSVLVTVPYFVVDAS